MYYSVSWLVRKRTPWDSSLWTQPSSIIIPNRDEVCTGARVAGVVRAQILLDRAHFSIGASGTDANWRATELSTKVKPGTPATLKE